MTDQEFIKKCLVCGDRAIGNNFDALSCESCKAFFRRNAVKNKELKCHFDDNCEIDVLTRRFCKKCRLKKCYAIGMKKDWILSSDEKKERKCKIEMNKKRRKNSVVSNQDSTSCSQSCSSGSPESADNQDNVDTLDLNGIEPLEIPDTFDIPDLDIDIDEINTQIMEIEKYIKDEDVVDGAEEDSDEISDVVYQKAAELEFTVLPIARPMGDKYQLNEMESYKLSELFNATTFFKEPIVPVTSQAMHYEDMCSLLCKKAEEQIRRVIKMSKHLTSFNDINEDDKISLIKFGAMDLFCMRSVPHYDYTNKTWVYTMNNSNSVVLSIELMRNCPRDIYSYYKKFLDKIGKEFESDPVVLDLLTAITLFNPDRPRLTNREFVKLQQNIYMYLLQRYLLLRYRSESQSKLKFLRLLNTLIDLNALGHTYRTNCSEKDPDAVSPFMREIFEIKTNTEIDNNVPINNNNSNILIY